MPRFSLWKSISLIWILLVASIVTFQWILEQLQSKSLVCGIHLYTVLMDIEDALSPVWWLRLCNLSTCLECRRPRRDFPKARVPGFNCLPDSIDANMAQELLEMRGMLRVPRTWWNDLAIPPPETHLPPPQNTTASIVAWCILGFELFSLPLKHWTVLLCNCCWTVRWTMRR